MTVCFHLLLRAPVLLLGTFYKLVPTSVWGHPAGKTKTWVNTVAGRPGEHQSAMKVVCTVPLPGLLMLMRVLLSNRGRVNATGVAGSVGDPKYTGLPLPGLTNGRRL
jgi:hypothetical protein